MQQSLKTLLSIGLLAGVAQAQEGPYCGNGPRPNIDRCNDALAKVDPDSDTSQAEFRAGDCEIHIADYAVGTSPPTLQGQTIIDKVHQILDTCDTSGWAYDGPDSRVNISVSQCVICMYGTCTVCNAPTEKRSYPVRLPGTPVARNPHAAAAAAPDADAVERRDERAPGVNCRSDAAGVSNDDCRGTFPAMEGKDLELPFQTTNGGCSVSLQAKKQGARASGDDVIGRMESDMNICGPGGNGQDPGVGKVVDSNPEDYDLFFGGFCGEFGQGIAQCVP